MNQVIIEILEVIKYILPALVVFATIYYMMKKYHSQQYDMEVLKFRQSESKNTLPLKLQAYERLALLCERIRPAQLLIRLNSPNMTAKALRNAMLVAVQKEFEHNITQQIYVSDSLWKIITLSKDQVLNLISSIEIEENNVSQSAADEVFKSLSKFNINPVDQALKAIKQETELII